MANVPQTTPDIRETLQQSMLLEPSVSFTVLTCGTTTKRIMVVVIHNVDDSVFFPEQLKPNKMIWSKPRSVYE